MDVSGSWQNLTLASEEGAVLTLTLDGPELYDLATNEITYYGDDTLTPLTLPTGKSKIINIDASIEEAVSAKVRVAYNRESFTPGESFFVFVNDQAISVPTGVLEFDDGDFGMVSREVEVPLNALIDGTNEVYADFVGNGGELITAVLVVTSSIGDFNGSGAFDGEDISLLVDQFGPATIDSKFDLSGDGMVDMTDVDYWLSELRGTSVGLGDFDLDDDVDVADLAIWAAGFGLDADYGQGDLDLDGDSDGTDFLAWQTRRTSAATSSAGLGTIPEPTVLLLMVSAISILLARRSQII